MTSKKKGKNHQHKGRPKIQIMQPPSFGDHAYDGIIIQMLMSAKYIYIYIEREREREMVRKKGLGLN